MKVANVMTKKPCTINCEENVLTAAQTLAENDIGALPVIEDDRIVGMITDRDIVVRVVARNGDPSSTRVKDIVSSQPKYCYEDEDIDHVARNMDELLVRRLPVMNREKKLVGIVSIEDLRPRTD